MYPSISRSSRVATRSTIGDDSVDVVPLWPSSYRPRWLSADIDSNTPTLHRHINDTSLIFHRLPADISINILSICLIDTSSLSRSTFDRQWPLWCSKSESNWCYYFRNFTVLGIFANKLLAFSLFLSHFACLFLRYSILDADLYFAFAGKILSSFRVVQCINRYFTDT